MAYRDSGWKGVYWLRLEDLKARRSEGEFGVAYSIATRCALLGKPDEAFEWLEIAFNERDGGLIELKVNLSLDNFRSDPRYKDLLRRMGFPE